MDQRTGLWLIFLNHKIPFHVSDYQDILTMELLSFKTQIKYLYVVLILLTAHKQMDMSM